MQPGRFDAERGTFLMWAGWNAVRKDDMAQTDLQQGGKLQPDDAPRFKRKKPLPGKEPLCPASSASPSGNT